MKKILLYILLLITISCCIDNNEKKLFNICKEIIENPEKIYDLKNNYPNYYRDEYIAKEMKDTSFLKILYHNTDSMFQRNINILLQGTNLYSKIDSGIISKYYYQEYYYNKINKDIRDKIEIYDIKFWKTRDHGVIFQFIKNNNKYFFYRIYNPIEANL